eukprot:Clim_evm26s147 gene=Clim_evmTU26s147
MCQGPYTYNPAQTASASTYNMDSKSEEAKKEERLQKNREAAKLCRAKKKEYVKCLEDRVKKLENLNLALIAELRTARQEVTQMRQQMDGVQSAPHPGPPGMHKHQVPVHPGDPHIVGPYSTPSARSWDVEQITSGSNPQLYGAPLGQPVGGANTEKYQHSPFLK